MWSPHADHHHCLGDHKKAGKARRGNSLTRFLLKVWYNEIEKEALHQQHPFVAPFKTVTDISIFLQKITELG